MKAKKLTKNERINTRKIKTINKTTNEKINKTLRRKTITKKK